MGVRCAVLHLHTCLHLAAITVALGCTSRGTSSFCEAHGTAGHSDSLGGRGESSTLLPRMARAWLLSPALCSLPSCASSAGVCWLSRTDKTQRLF